MKDNKVAIKDTFEYAVFKDFIHDYSKTEEYEKYCSIDEIRDNAFILTRMTNPINKGIEHIMVAKCEKGQFSDVRFTVSLLDAFITYAKLLKDHEIIFDLDKYRVFEYRILYDKLDNLGLSLLKK